MNELLGGIFGLVLFLYVAYWMFWPIKGKPVVEQKQFSKETDKHGQHEIGASVKPNQKSQHNHVPMPKGTRNVRRSDDTRSDDFMNPLNPISPNYIGNYATSNSEHKAHDCQPSHDYGSSSYSSSDSCSSSSDSGSSSSSGD